MKNTMKRLFLLAAVLLMVFAGCAMAEENNAPAEEVVLFADLAAFKETGELFEGIRPGMSLDEVVSAGLPLITDTWWIPMMSEESQVFDVRENCVVMMEGIRIIASEGMGAFTCLFHSGALCGIMNFFPEEEYLLEEILPIFTAVLGEPTEQNTKESEHMGWDYSRYTTWETHVKWVYDIQGEEVEFSVSAVDRGQGAVVSNISAHYNSYL